MARNDLEKNNQGSIEDGQSSLKTQIEAKRSPDFSSSTLRRVAFGLLR